MQQKIQKIRFLNDSRYIDSRTRRPISSRADISICRYTLLDLKGLKAIFCRKNLSKKARKSISANETKQRASVM